MAHIRANGLTWRDSHLEIVLDSRKNDQFREGSLVVVTELPQSYACPVQLAQILVFHAGLAGTSRPLFSAVTVRDGVSTYGDTPASYQYLRKGVLDAFAAVGLSSLQFGLHSLRSGGATLAANQGISERLWMEHGGWRSQRSAFGYVKTSVEAKACVTKAMFPAP